MPLSAATVARQGLCAVGAVVLSLRGLTAVGGRTCDGGIEDGIPHGSRPGIWAGCWSDSSSSLTLAAIESVKRTTNGITTQYPAGGPPYSRAKWQNQTCYPMLVDRDLGFVDIS
ncbi:hypothetical protein F5148DRAFT_1215384 [Russula earlei]|uniref:Uncharacterized protein n=1 Tax=Russula earlei TaxID=71964 RepID=A0ACC0U3G4_9AGAM|nr:hypothetical protein F5148DRAFT_1215384 [Russula earlei]